MDLKYSVTIFCTADKIVHDRMCNKYNNLFHELWICQKYRKAFERSVSYYETIILAHL